METSLTSNRVFKTLISFSVPYLLSCFLQTLYGMADLFIVGQFNGVDSTTAVSVGSQVMHMLTVMIVGLAMGSTVLIGKTVGAKQKEDTSFAVGNTILLFVVVSIFLTAVLILAVRPIVSVMSTPKEAISGTVTYLTICFIGIPFITAYNVLCSIFRGMGNSKSPMYFVAIACVANIALDFLFIGAFHMNAAGAALGTTVSQALSAIISILMIRYKKMGISLSRENLYPKKSVMGEILKIGIPVSLQDGFIQISFLMITMFANQRGLHAAAAVGVVEKIIGILFLVPSSMLSAVSALSAQYIGAGKNDLARRTLRYAIMVSVGFGLFSTLVMQFAAESVVSVFVDDPVARVMGGQYMRGYVWDCVLAGIHFCLSGYFCAYSLSGISFMHNAISILVARIPLSYLGAKYFPDTLLPMGLAPAVGSFLSVTICTGAYIWLRKRTLKGALYE